MQHGLHARPYDPRGPHFGAFVGVVIALQFSDDEGRPARPGVLCDVLTDTFGLLVGVPVLQHGAAVGNGSRWVPTPTTAEIDGAPLDLRTAYPNLDALDGDRVVVQFLQGQVSSPIIVGALEHPRALEGHTREGHPLPSPAQPGSAWPGPDGQERWTRHQGTVARLDRLGNARLDTTRAGTHNDGQIRLSDTPSGHVDIDLARDAELVIRVEGQPVFRLRVDDGGVQLDIGGDGGEPLVLGERLMSIFDTHRHLLPEVPPHVHKAVGAPDPRDGTPLTGLPEVIDGVPGLEVGESCTGQPLPGDSMAAAQSEPERAALSGRVRVEAR